MTVLATCATLWGVAGSFSSLLRAAALVGAGLAREISIPFIAILTGRCDLARVQHRDHELLLSVTDSSVSAAAL